MNSKLFTLLTASLFLTLSLSCSSAAVNVNVNTAATNSNANEAPPAPPSDAGAADQAGLAEKVVADLYKAHDGKKSPFFQNKDRALVDRYFTRPLAHLIWKDATTTPEGEVGNLDFDPLYNAQDTEINNFAVGRADIKGETGVVPVTFTNFGSKVSIKYNVKLVNGNWKIDDINYGEIGTLVKILKSSGQPETASGNFEGKYQVGDTSCTVKAVKMAYEVRWAKGSGAELFFSQDRTTFESSSDKGQSNRFVFDDDSYDKGTFYRGDGKTFPVRRAT